MISIDVFVVLYRRKIAESETVQSLLRSTTACTQLQLRVQLWDNSPEADAQAVILAPDWRYSWNGHNAPLSVAYNAMLLHAASPYVLVFDQDSRFEPDFLDALCAAMRAVPADMYVPRIAHQGRVISPCRLRWIKGAALPGVTPGTVLPRCFTAMMSGLCISQRFLWSLGPAPFDERLRFYGIDTRLCRELNLRGGRAYVHRGTLDHDSALRDRRDPEQYVQRKIWLMRSWRHVFDRNRLERLGVHLYIAWTVLRLVSGPGRRRGARSILAEVYR
ncbi:glycosyltransferase [Pseudoxanthomonas winnipegensis]|uniref:glycosyltransferase family 2 protein n=1 Tax=Pseudoxanthomonas winnipegensis TaxID=2480810 RepID=UPI00102D9B6F|nr:glycosyltransferase [Pseudoxanthomonas winnipegensis]TAA44276.1 glycosyltransferase [Pseudoxanthomonas winnipegensis]